jgi:glycosyltransferase involved in cell wall biosynthesis
MAESLNNIFLITNIPTPYRIPLFNELQKQLYEKGLKLKVIFGALGYPRRKWIIDLSLCKFDYEVLPSRRLTLFDHEKVIFTYRGLLKLVMKEKPKIIITNAFSIATTKLWLTSWFRNVNYIIWSGAIESKQRPDSKIRRIHRKLLIKRAVGFIAYGTKAKEYLVNLGAKPERIGIGINTVDTDFFQKKLRKYRDGLEIENNKKNLLYVGYLVKRKRLDLLLKSIEILAKKRSDFILKIVGDGPEKENLVKLVDNLGIAKFVSFEGYKQKEELIKYYAEADCFLFPTDFDIWGLVLVEAMAAGLPCIASINAGATQDLINDASNGFIADFYDFKSIANKINWVLDNPDLAAKIGLSARIFINNNINLRKAARGFTSTIQKCLL